jgi:Tfp pilus assembly protein PilO
VVDRPELLRLVVRFLIALRISALGFDLLLRGRQQRRVQLQSLAA